MQEKEFEEFPKVFVVSKICGLPRKECALGANQGRTLVLIAFDCSLTANNHKQSENADIKVFHKNTFFLSDPGIPGPIYGSGCLKLTTRRFADLTDVTLVDEDTKSILTDNVNRAIQGNQAMHVSLVYKFVSYASGAIWWSNL